MPIGADGGAPQRIISDADLRDVTATPADVGADAGGSDMGGTDAPGLRITIDVTKPATQQVLPAAQLFAPQVEVTVDSPSFRAEDVLKEVTATLNKPPTQMRVATVKLNQVGLTNVPETGTVRYRFADTPLDLGGVESGAYDLVFVATTNGGSKAEVTVTVLVDAGPTIRIDSPIKDKSYKGSAAVDVTIADELFGPVSDVQLRVGTHDVTVMGPGGASGRQYTGTIDFAAFMPALEGDQLLTVRAKNRNGTESVATRKFVSDSRGPTIANESPKPGALIGNVITISADVTDPAGVAPSSVVAVFANGPGSDYIVNLLPPPAGSMTPTYSAVFDTRKLPFAKNSILPTLSFRASDTLGNESTMTNVVSLDNHPPLAELDPPEMRMDTIVEDKTQRCSWPFDPVGPDAVDDGDLVPQIMDVRARVEDQGNEPLTGTPNYIPIAGVAKAELLLLDDTNQALVVNTNPTDKGDIKGDLTCDAVNPLLVPTTRPMTDKDALLITMDSIRHTGNADFTNDHPPPGARRVLVGDDMSCLGGGILKAPDSACNTSVNMAKAKWEVEAFVTVDGNGNESLSIRAIPHQQVVTTWMSYATGPGGRLPSIWTIPPVSRDGAAIDPTCGGNQLDALANNVKDGWVCLAVLATDRLGNRQVSRPMRLCVDKDGMGNECPHRKIVRVRDTTPLEVETEGPHGLVTGDAVKVTGIEMKTVVNGVWTITRVDDRRFTLATSKAQPSFGVFPSPWGDWYRPSSPPGQPNRFLSGYAVKLSEMPNCTGTQTAEPPMPAVDNTKSCAPWRLYTPGERRFSTGL